ncbi:MAG: hypothetical protein ACI9O0_000551 [Paracoccaceae bacterium]|jgi:hypothetical protein
MRILAWAVAAVALLWSGYWFFTSRIAHHTILSFIEQARNNGAVIDYSDLNLEGFPNRFDLTVSAPLVQNAAKSFHYHSDFIQFLSLSYSPWHVIVAFAPRQDLVLFGKNLEIETDKAQASIVMSPTKNLALERLIFMGSGLRFRNDSGALGQASSFDMGLRARDALPTDGATDRRYQLGLRATNLKLAFTDGPTQIFLQLDMLLDRPIDGKIWHENPMPRAFDLSNFSLIWNMAELTAAGQVSADSRGLAQGRIMLTLQNWQVFFDFAVAQNWISPKARQGIKNLGQALSQGKDRLELPLFVKDNWVSLGPVPLGKLPATFAKISP